MTAPAKKGWPAKSPNARARLLALLSDGKWHGMAELQAVAGFRYGARLRELRQGKGLAAPLVIESRALTGDSSVWRYRLIRKAVAHG